MQMGFDLSLRRLRFLILTHLFTRFALLEAARYRACASRLEAARYRACASRLEAARYRACASRRACVPYGCGLSALRFARSRSRHHELDEVAEPAAKPPLVVVPGEYFHHTIPNRVRERSIDDR